MSTAKSFITASLVGLAASVLLSGPVRAEFPDKPITMIVPWAAGGSTDQTARVLAKAAEAHLGQPIVIVNRPGASTTIGMAELARAKPDGYTIGTLSSSGYLIALQGRKLPYHPVNDFTYISYYGDNVIGVAVLASTPWKSLSELLEAGKKDPGKYKYGTAGVGGTQHLTMEALQRTSGVKFVHIPQQGSAASMPALLGKHVDFIMETSVWAPFVADKQVRLLAVTTPERAKSYPDVPTLNELGFRTVRSVQGVIAPAGVPEPIRAKLESAFRKALGDKAFRETMQRLAMEVVDMPGPDVKKLIENEYELAGQLIKDLKAK